MPLNPEEPKNHESVPGPRAVPDGSPAAQPPRPVPSPGLRPIPTPAVPRRTTPRSAQSRGGRSHSRGVPGGSSPRSGRPGAARNGAPLPRAPRDPVQIQLVSATTKTAVAVADETVDHLLDAGRRPEEILVLTTGEEHPWQQHESSFGEESYWRQFDDGGDVFYAHTSAMRTARRPVVVVAVNGGTDEQTAQALPRALSRAGSLLVVCGDADRLRMLLGVPEAPPRGVATASA